MKVVSVQCNHCGAPLEVGVKTRFATCGFCNSKLEVKRSDSAVYTDVLEAVSDVREELETLKLESRLDRLDRDWERARESFMWTDKHGQRHLPTKGGSIFGIVVAVAIGVVAMAAMPQAWFVGLLVVGVGSVFGYAGYGRAERFERARENYRQRRRAILRELQGRA